MTILNINIGVLGHVDSGKTSLAKALSTVASTSAFDKNPQSKKRGITLDLGFSSFVVHRSIKRTNPDTKPDEQVQFTLVDCPGHGSLIRTVMCGSRIIDLMLLVVDVTKGFQTQTAECLVIGTITCDQMIVVLNKCDLLPVETRGASIEKMRKRVSKTLENTKYRNCPIAAVSAAPGGVQADFFPDDRQQCNEDIKELIELLVQTVSDPSERRRLVRDQDFLFAVDHCFAVTGQGTVMTGTVLAGSTRVGDLIELPYQRIQKKIKSIQMFRQPVNSVGPGDRAGICVSQLDPGVLERGLVGTPSRGNLIPCHACVLRDVQKISYFKLPVCSKARFHVFVGQETGLARLTFFFAPSNYSEEGDKADDMLDLSAKYPSEYVEELPNAEDASHRSIWVLLEFDRTFVCPKGSLVIGAKLDNTSTTACRLAFYGYIQMQFTDPNYKQSVLPQLSVFRRKSRTGVVDRMLDSRTCVVHGLFKRETNWDVFCGLRAHILQEPTAGDQNGQCILAKGRIESSFGQSGKCRLALDEELPEDIVLQFTRKVGKKAADAQPRAETQHRPHLTVVLEFKRFIFDPKRRLVQ